MVKLIGEIVINLHRSIAPKSDTCPRPKTISSYSIKVIVKSSRWSITYSLQKVGLLKVSLKRLNLIILRLSKNQILSVKYMLCFVTRFINAENYLLYKIASRSVEIYTFVNFIWVTGSLRKIVLEYSGDYTSSVIAIGNHHTCQLCVFP